MKTRALLLPLLFLFALSALTACRSRRTAPPPETAPPIAETVAPEPAEPVPTPERDFVAPEMETPEVLSEDIAEANRQARANGWIRDAFFAFDASTLDEDAQEALRRSATWLREHPDLDLLIEGHCDDRGTEQYNLALGERRASTAMAFLSALGIAESRIETVSYGEERPFETGATEEAWAQNRRAHLVLVKPRG
jgi:peptidoglycan-associated lipoprotein